MNMAHNKDNGTDITNESKVTNIEPIIIGKTPNWPSLGAQVLPVKKWKNPYDWNAGIASLTINANIVKITRMEKIAVINNPFSIKNSLMFLVSIKPLWIYFEVLIIFSSANTLPPSSLKTQSMKFLVSPVGSPLVKNKNGLCTR